MARVEMRRIREGEVPPDGGTAIQEDADRPVFAGNGPDDYVCVECGNVLAESMQPHPDDAQGPHPLRALPHDQRRGHRHQGLADQDPLMTEGVPERLWSRSLAAGRVGVWPLASSSATSSRSPCSA